MEPKTDQITATSQTEEAATTVEHRGAASLASSEESSQIARDQLYVADSFLRAIAEQFSGLPRSIIRELNVALVTPTLCAFIRNEESSKLMFEALHFMQDLRRGRIKDYEERLMDSDTSVGAARASPGLRISSASYYPLCVRNPRRLHPKRYPAYASSMYGTRKTQLQMLQRRRSRRTTLN
jgi:hypothetical protein